MLNLGSLLVYQQLLPITSKSYCILVLQQLTTLGWQVKLLLVRVVVVRMGLLVNASIICLITQQVKLIVQRMAGHIRQVVRALVWV